MKYYYYCKECKQDVDKYFAENDLHPCKVPLEKRERPKSGYWYKTFTDECVLCGAGETCRVRQYSPKPDDPADRYAYEQTVCQYHFM